MTDDPEGVAFAKVPFARSGDTRSRAGPLAVIQTTKNLNRAIDASKYSAALSRECLDRSIRRSAHGLKLGFAPRWSPFLRP